MSASPRSGTSTPVVAWLGAPLPGGVAQSLARVADLQTDWTPDAQLIVVWAPAGLDQLRRLPRRTRRPPVIAAANHEPTHAERMAWIRAGADDLVSLRALPGALAQRLGALPQTDSVPAEVAPPISRRDPTSLVEPFALPESSSRPPPTPKPQADAFPPLQVPQPDGGVPDAVRPWIMALQRYLQLRDLWVERWGGSGLDRLLELAHLRAQVPGAISQELSFNTFGMAHGTAGEALRWPVRVRRGPSRGRPIEVAEGEVIHAGTDGLVVDLAFESSERQKLVVDLMVEEGVNAQFLLEARWQKRVATKRWRVGLLVIEMRLRPIGG